jgi:hypothetical protein
MSGEAVGHGNWDEDGIGDGKEERRVGALERRGDREWLLEQLGTVAVRDFLGGCLGGETVGEVVESRIDGDEPGHSDAVALVVPLPV